MNNQFDLTPENEFDQSRLKAIRGKFSKLGFSYFAYYFGTQFLAVLALGLLQPYVDINSGLWQSVVTVLFIYAVGAPILFLMLRDNKAEKPEKQKIGVLDFIISFVICIAIMNIGSLLGQYSVAILEHFLGYTIENSLEQSLTGPDAWAFVIYSVLIVPIVEELIWRKWIIDRTHRYGAVLSIVFSSLFFALMHANIHQFFYAFLVGMFFGFIYMKSGKIWITMALHMMVNLLCGVLPAFIMEHLDLVAMQEALLNPETWSAFFEANTWQCIAYSAYSLFVNGACIVGTIFFFVFRKRLSLEGHQDELPKKLRGYAAFFNPGAFLFIAGAVALWLFSVVSMNPNLLQG